MTFDPELPSGSGTGAILRALGSLMAALGGEDTRAAAAAPAPRREAAPAYAPTYAPGYATPEPPAVGYDPGPTATSVEGILSEGRDRAERILQDATQRANQLLARERGAAAGIEAGEPIRRSVDELLVNMRDVQARLGRIEGILASRPAASAIPVPPPQRPPFPPAEEERRPGVLSVVAPQAPRPPAPPPAVLTAPLPPLPANAPTSPVPPSAVPPMRGGAQPAAAQMPIPQYEDEPVRETVPDLVPATWQRGQHEQETGGTLATFTPADGSVLLRAAPVSGFQGLMRLQDALQRIPAVRQATVEAYSQGEARLRLEIGSDIDSDEIAEHVSAGVGQSAQVREASEAERTIVIAFG